MDLTSQIQVISAPIAQVYAKASDLRNLESLVQKSPTPSIKIEVENESRCRLHAPMVGAVCCEIIERKPCQEVKMQTVDSPLTATIWLQLVAIDEASCKVRITLRTDLNPMLQVMAKKPLQEAIDKLAFLLTQISYE